MTEAKKNFVKHSVFNTAQESSSFLVCGFIRRINETITMATIILYLLFASAVPILASNVLYIAPINASSHNMWNTFLATEIAKRGHKVTYISGTDLKGPFHPNITASVFKQTEEMRMQWMELFSVSLSGTVLQTLETVESTMLNDCIHMFRDGIYKDLISPSNKDTYDVIAMEHAGQDCLLGLSHRFKAPIVLLNPLTYTPHWFNRLMGVPVFHMAPHAAESQKPPYNFWTRLESLKIYLLGDYHYYSHTKPKHEETVRKIFGPDSLPYEKLINNVALAITNTPPWMDKIPLPANVIPIAGIHLVEAKPLSDELENFVNGAEHGVILISFGTIVPIYEYGTKVFETIAAAVGKLPQRVLWKWDEQISDKSIKFPKNVLRLPWIPQNDVLGHSKMRLFVSHCGGQSTLETAFHGIPVLAIPGFWDQYENSNRLAAEGAAVRLDLKDITVKSFIDTASEILNNERYYEAAKRLKAVIRDRPMKPLDHVLFWIEFVIRNRGAPHLRPLLWDLPPYTLFADIAIVVAVAVISVLLVLVFLLRCFQITKNLYLQPTRSKNKND